MRLPALTVLLLAACGESTPAMTLDGALPEGFDGPVRLTDGPNADGAAGGGDAPAVVGGGLVVARDQPRPRALVVNGGFVYFASYLPAAGGGAISRVAVAGGEVEVLATAQPYPADLVVDDEGAYWVTAGEPSIPACVTALPHGGTPTCLEPRPSANGPSAIAAGGAFLYWSEAQSGDVRVIPKAGGESSRLGPRQVHPAGVTTVGSSLVWVNDEPESMFSRGGVVRSIPLAGGEEVTLAEGQRHPFRIVSDGASLYWTSSGTWGAGDGEVVAASLAGGPPVVLATGLAFPAGLAVDGGFLYVAASGDGTIRRIPTAGGPAAILASGLSAPHGVATDASFVYYTDEAGTIGRIAK